MSTPETLFQIQSAARLRTNLDRIRAALEKIPAASIWARPNEGSNSAGNLCMHLAGNVRQMILHAVAGQADVRQRDVEFSTRDGASAADLIANLATAVNETCGVIESLSFARLCETVQFRDRDWTVLELVYTVVEHFALHTGQIIYISKAAGTMPQK